MTETELRAKFAQIDRERAYYNWRCDNSSVKPSPCLGGGCVDNRPTVKATVDVKGDGKIVDTLLLCDGCLQLLKARTKKDRAAIAKTGFSNRDTKGWYKIKTTPATFEG